jgi:hypothetical protein
MRHIPRVEVVRKAASHVGHELMAPRRRPRVRRLGSLLYHWGSGRTDLHVETYGRIP